jgi:S-adenosylmethionine decarboxylase
MLYSQAMQGLHLTADLRRCQCEAAWRTDAARQGAAGLQPVGQLFHAFPALAGESAGFTATVLLAESRLCVHTWPELSAVTLDVYVCNFGGDHSAKAHALMHALLQIFQATEVIRNTLERGRIH